MFNTLNHEFQLKLMLILLSEECVEGVARSYHEEIRKRSFDNYQTLVLDAVKDKSLAKALNHLWRKQPNELLDFLKNLRTNPITPSLYTTVKQKLIPNPYYIWN